MTVAQVDWRRWWPLLVAFVANDSAPNTHYRAIAAMYRQRFRPSSVSPLSTQ